tara:strand:+ start:131 stop:550 length:420 start_codon:yes stop_codon:yes gene_type:complete
MYALFTRVYLNPRTQQYETIVTIDRRPSDVDGLQQIVRPIRLPVLSPFKAQGRYSCSGGGSTYGLLSLDSTSMFMSGDDWMTPVELPRLFSYLAESGYSVNTDLTRMLNDGPVSGLVSNGGGTGDETSGGLICYIQKMK